MGRLLLLTPLLLGWAAGCAPEERPDRSGAAHAGVACSTCHRGDVADVGMASVPHEGCTGSACHADGGPAELAVHTVRSFAHRSHGAGSVVTPGCAGCHTHLEGALPLEASVDACALCHAAGMTGANPADCQTCHVHPDNVALTSQGLELPHEGLPWIEGGCIRCHYDVAEPQVAVSADRCGSCHAQMADMTAAGIGVDLHPDHEGVACTTCHASGSHRIRAVSSAVALSCRDCHRTAHGDPVQPGPGPSAQCNSCHGGVHADQQRLLLGLVPSRLSAAPSGKFMMGLTCRSCHVAPSPATSAADAPFGGGAEACVQCHRAEYATVLSWWQNGASQRLRLAAAYRNEAQVALADNPAPDSVAALLQAGAELIALVERGGASHNLELAHELFEEAVGLTGLAYGVAGRVSPPAPDLGRAPRMGLCTYCHYDPGQVLDPARIPADFHRSLMASAGR